jgi:hypothetical protein
MVPVKRFNILRLYETPPKLQPYGHCEPFDTDLTYCLFKRLRICKTPANSWSYDSCEKFQCSPLVKLVKRHLYSSRETSLKVFPLHLHLS